MEELGRFKESTKVSSCQQLTLTGFQVSPLKKGKSFLLLYQCPKKGAQNRALCHSHPQNKGTLHNLVYFDSDCW